MKTYFDIKLYNAPFVWQSQSAGTQLNAVNSFKPRAVADCGVILGISEACENYHIEIGEPLETALVKCADLLTEAPDYALFRQKSAEFFELCSRFGMARSIAYDECLVELDGLDPAEIESFAAALGGAVHEELGLEADITTSFAFSAPLNRYCYSVPFGASALASLAGMTAFRLKLDGNAARLFSLTVTEKNGITKTIDKRLDLPCDDAEMILFVLKALYESEAEPSEISLSLFDICVKPDPSPQKEEKKPNIKAKFRRKTSWHYTKENQRLTGILNQNNLKKYSNLCDYIRGTEDDFIQLCALAEKANTRRLKLGDYYVNSPYAERFIAELPEVGDGEVSILIDGYCPFLLVFLLAERYGGQTTFYLHNVDGRSEELLRLLNEHSPYHGIALCREEKREYNLAVTGGGSVLPKSKYELHLVRKSFFSGEERNELCARCISKIIDFGKDGFVGVTTQFSALLIDSLGTPENTLVCSLEGDYSLCQSQQYITDASLPCWVLYRNAVFDEVYAKMQFGIFNVFCDSQIKTRDLSAGGDVKIVTAAYIGGDGAVTIAPDCACISSNIIKDYDVGAYLNQEDLLIAPRMSRTLKIGRKPPGCATNSSTAILIPKESVTFSDEDIGYLFSKEFQRFYDIALNHQAFSLAGGTPSLYFIGKRK